MKEKSKFYILILGTIIVLFSWLFFFYFSLLDQQNKIEIETAELHNLYDSADAQKQRLTVLNSTLLKLNLQIDELSSNLVSDKMIYHLDSLLTDSFKSYDIRLRSVSPQIEYYLKELPQKTNRQYFGLPVSLEIETDYINLTSWLDQLSTMPFAMKPVLMTIQSNSRNNGNKIIVTVGVIVYLKQYGVNYEI